MFIVTMQERFRGGPDVKTEQINISISRMFDNMKDVSEYINNDILKIRMYKNVLYERRITFKDRIVIKILFERPNKHGRLLREYWIRKEDVHPSIDDFLLI